MTEWQGPPDSAACGHQGRDDGLSVWLGSRVRGDDEGALGFRLPARPLD
jgi:hypothetical protein